MSHKRSQKTHSRQSLMDWAVLNSVMHLEKKLRWLKRKGSSHHILCNRFTVEEITQKLAELSYKCLPSWVSATMSSKRSLIARPPVELISPCFVLQCGHLTSKSEMLCLRPNWNTATEVIKWQHLSNAKERPTWVYTLASEDFILTTNCSIE